MTKTSTASTASRITNVRIHARGVTCIRAFQEWQETWRSLPPVLRAHRPRTDRRMRCDDDATPREYSPPREESTAPDRLPRRLQHLAELPLQVGDLVADARRHLELQLACRRVHLLGQFRDQVGKLGGRHRGEGAGVL